MLYKLSDQYLILLYEYEISIALLGYAVFIVTSALSIKYFRLDALHKVSCWVNMLFAVVQMGCCFYWWRYTNVSEYYGTLDLITHPVQFYFSIFCNPVCPLLVVWFYRCHLLELSTGSTACMIYRTPSAGIAISVVGGLICGGIADMLLMREVIGSISTVWKLLFGMACLASWMEISWQRLENRSALIVYSFFWYVGAWLYFFSKI